MENLSDFDFYLKFAKPLVLNLSNANDKILAAAWIKKLIDDQSGNEEVKTAYLKLLLFVLQRKTLIGPFKKHPNEFDTLEAFPDGQDLVQIAKDLLEKEQTDLKEKIENRLKNESSVGDSYISDYSADYLEYVAVQHIENFGVHGYYALAKEPLSSWHRVDKQLMPKAAISTLDVSAMPKSLNSTFSSPEIPKQPRAADGSPKKKSVEIVEPITPKKPKKRSPKKSVLGASPPVAPMGRVPSEEDREPPTWGSNLLKVQEHTPNLMADSGLGASLLNPAEGDDTTMAAPLLSDLEEEDDGGGDDRVQDLWTSGGSAPYRTPPVPRVSPPPSPFDYGTMDARGYTPSPRAPSPPRPREPSPVKQGPPPRRIQPPSRLQPPRARAPSPPARAASPPGTKTLVAVKPDNFQGGAASEGENQWDLEALHEMGLTEDDMKDISLGCLESDMSDLSASEDEVEPEYYSDIDDDVKALDNEETEFSKLLRELEEKWADDIAEYGDQVEAGDLNELVARKTPEITAWDTTDSSVSAGVSPLPNYSTESSYRSASPSPSPSPKRSPIPTRQAILVSKEAKGILEEVEAIKQGEQGPKAKKSSPGKKKIPTAPAGRLRRPSLTAQRTPSACRAMPTSATRLSPQQQQQLQQQSSNVPQRRLSGLKPPGAPIPQQQQQPQQQQRRRSSGIKPPGAPIAQMGQSQGRGRRTSGLKPPGAPIYGQPQQRQQQPVVLTADAVPYGYDDQDLGEFERLERMAESSPDRRGRPVRTLTATPSPGKDDNAMALYNRICEAAERQNRELDESDAGRRQSTGSATVAFAERRTDFDRRDAVDDYGDPDELEGDGRRPRSPVLLNEEKALEALKDITMASREFSAASPAISGNVPVTSPKPTVSPLRLPNTDAMLESPPRPIKRSYRPASPRPSPPHSRRANMENVDLDMSFRVPDEDDFDMDLAEMDRMRMIADHDTSFMLPDIEKHRDDIVVPPPPRINKDLDLERARDYRLHVIQQPVADYDEPYSRRIGGRVVTKGAGARGATLSPVEDLPEHLSYNQGQMLKNVRRAPGQIDRRPVSVVTRGGRRVDVPRRSGAPSLETVMEPIEYHTPVTRRSPQAAQSARGRGVNRKRLPRRRLDFDQIKATPPPRSPPRSPLVGPAPSPPAQFLMSPVAGGTPPWPDYDIPQPLPELQQQAVRSPSPRQQDGFESQLPGRGSGLLTDSTPPDFGTSPPSRTPSPVAVQTPPSPHTPGQSPYYELNAILPDNDDYMWDYQGADEETLYETPPPRQFTPSPMSRPGVLEDTMEEVKKRCSRMERRDMRHWSTGGKPGAQLMPDNYRLYYAKLGNQLENIPEFRGDEHLDLEAMPRDYRSPEQGRRLSPTQEMNLPPEMTQSPPWPDYDIPGHQPPRQQVADRPQSPGCHTLDQEERPDELAYSPTLPNIDGYRSPQEWEDADTTLYDEEQPDIVGGSPLDDDGFDDWHQRQLGKLRGDICPPCSDSPTGSPGELARLKEHLRQPQYSGITKQPMMVGGKVMPVSYRYMYQRLNKVPEDEMGEMLPEMANVVSPPVRTPPPKRRGRPTTSYVPPASPRTPPPRETKDRPKMWAARRRIDFDQEQSPPSPYYSPPPQVTLDRLSPPARLPSPPRPSPSPGRRPQRVVEDEFDQMTTSGGYETFEEEPPEDLDFDPCSPCSPCSGSREGSPSPGDLSRQLQQHSYTDQRGNRGADMSRYVGTQKRPLRGKQAPGLPDVREQ